MSAPDPDVRHDAPLGLTPRDAARVLGVSLGTVRRWETEGHLQCTRTPGNQRRFSYRQLDEFLTRSMEGTRG